MRRRVPLYLVGGAVRDLLLGREVADLDLAVEGDGADFGRALASELGARARVHGRFGTASLDFPDGSRLDVASTRTETYTSPGSLPGVTAAALEDDLARRDFTINAMAVRISPGRPELLDPHGGALDLARGQVRMLHPQSPRDDPTRAFRAARYANRLGFTVESRTRRWIRDALDSGAFEAVSGDRLRRELRLLFSEDNPAGALRQMCRLGLERAVGPGLSSGTAVFRSLRRAEEIARRHRGKTGWLLFLLVWCGRAGPAAVRRVTDRLSLSGKERRIALRWPEDLEKLLRGGNRRIASRASASEIAADELAAAAALAPRAASRALERTLGSAQKELSIRGRDLLAAGLPPGPGIGRALAATLDAVREGRILPKEELGFAVAVATREAS